MEWPVPGTNHPADVAWKIDGAWHVFEVVATCHDNLPSHLKACFIDSSDVATVTIVAPQKRMLKKLQGIVEAVPELTPFQERIRYEPIEPFVKELWK